MRQYISEQTTKLLTVVLAAFCLVACEPRHYEVVEQACVEDGHGPKYCRCLRQAMNEELGYRTFAVFTDLVVLGDDEQIAPGSVLQIMEKHQLTPARLAEIRETIDKAGAQAEQLCTH